MNYNHPQPPGNTCQATRADGSPCRAAPTPSGYCWAHDSDLRDKAKEARRLGGHNRSSTVRASRRTPRDMQDLARRLLEAVDKVESGELDPVKATAMARLAGAAVRVYELGEVEGRFARIEAQLEARPIHARR